MKNVIILCKDKCIYLIAALSGIVLMLPVAGSNEPVKTEYYLCAFSFALLGQNISYIIQFIPHFIPLFIIQFYWGISIYKSFCVASIYVFSRRNHRVKWALRELLMVLLKTVIFIASVIVPAFIMTTLSTQAVTDINTVIHAACMLIILSLYSFEMIALINLLSFFLESGVAFAIVQIINLLSLAMYLLSVNLKIDETIIMDFNLISRLMVEPDLDIWKVSFSLLYFLIPAVIISLLIVGAVKKTQFTKSIYEGDV